MAVRDAHGHAGASSWGAVLDLVEVPPGPPIGATRGARCSAHTVGVPRGATVLLVTDGLFERRGEPIDAGMERLRAAADVIGGGGSVQEDLDELMVLMTGWPRG